MITISLKRFIETGEFGTIKIGSKKGEVINILGEDYDYGDCGDSQIIKYGWYEFFYWTENEKIFGIQNDHLQMDCLNHDEMINFKNDNWMIDKWFLKDEENITFGQVKKLLESENIAYKIEPLYGCEENIIKCINSNVTFDFASEYSIIEFNEKEQPNEWIEITESEEDNYILNGIRLFKY